MPMQLPNLDDRTYTDLAEEARTLIPTYAPGWTNHNPSDPGIMLIELFAYLTEMLIYRLDQVTDNNVRSFLKLLDGKDRQAFRAHTQAPTAAGQALTTDIQATVRSLRKLERPVTCADFVTVVESAFPADPQNSLDAANAVPLRVARAHCVPQRNLCADYEAEQAGHISVIILPTEQTEQKHLPDLIAAVQRYLEDRRLLTTYVHVVGPIYLTVAIKTKLVLKRDVLLPGERAQSAMVARNTGDSHDDIRQKVVDAVKKFLDPRQGGQNGKGWPFGRNVFVSELYELLDQLPGVDYVTEIALAADADRLLQEEGFLIGVALRPYELVAVEMTMDDVKIE